MLAIDEQRSLFYIAHTFDAPYAAEELEDNQCIAETINYPNTGEMLT